MQSLSNKQHSLTFPCTIRPLSWIERKGFKGRFANLLDHQPPHTLQYNKKKLGYFSPLQASSQLQQLNCPKGNWSPSPSHYRNDVERQRLVIG